MRTVIKPGEYTFDASAKTVTLLTVGDPLIGEFILGIWNATDGVKIYDPHAPGYGGTIASTVLTLTFDTTTMSDSDTLLIFYEDPTVLASQLVVGDILAKLSGDPSTETTLAAILTKLIAAPSTEAKQDNIITLLNALGVDQAAGNALLGTISGKDFATQTTLAAILAKIIAAPATEAKQDTGNTALANILAKIITAPATEVKQDTMITALAAILAKLITAPATEAKQDTGNTSLATIAGKDFATQATLATMLSRIESIYTVVSGEESAEDVASASGDKAQRVLLAIRKAAPANLSTTDGDYEFLQMSAGALWVALSSALPSGTNNIGDVDVLTLPALAAGTNAIGKTSSAFQTTKGLTNATLTFSSSGENTLLAGTASQTIRVFIGSFTADSDVTLTFKDAASGNTLAVIPLTANGNFSFDTSASGEPLWVTASSGAFICSLSAAVAVNGFFQYTKS